MTTKNEHTGDSLITRQTTDAYRDNWDRIFGKNKEKMQEQKEALEELTQLSQELGLYEDKQE